MLARLLSQATAQRSRRWEDRASSAAGCLLISGIITGYVSLVIVGVVLLPVVLILYIYRLAVGR